MKIRLPPTPMPLLLILPLLACGGESPGGKISLENAWARPAPGFTEESGALSGGNTAVYLEIRNRGPGPDRLLGGETPAATSVEIHESVLEGDLARMRRRAGLDLPPGSVAELRPGGLHLMLLGLRRPLNDGDSLPLTLFFRDDPSVTIRVPVRGMSGR
jgi:copper(I)-binding protein